MTVLDILRTSTRLASRQETADWKVTAVAWSGDTGKVKQYTQFGTGSTPKGRSAVKWFLHIPDKSRVISVMYEYYGSMS